MNEDKHSVEIELDGYSSGSSSFADFGDTNSGDEDEARNVDLINIREADDYDEDEEALPNESDDPNYFPPTFLVVCLNPKIQPDAISWLVHKIKGTKRNGGAELLVKCEPFSDHKASESYKNIILHLSATNLRLLEVAEFLEMKKVDGNGYLREFIVRDLDSFLHGDILLQNLLSPAEKELIVLNELQNCRALPGEPCIPGYVDFTLHSGQSIFQKYVTEGLISYYYPLHDEIQLSKLLSTNWLRALWDPEPSEQIRRYFGEAITLYFSFSLFYTLCLVPPSIIIFILSLISDFYLNKSTKIIILCTLNVMWVTILLQHWKRKCSELAYTWGTIRMSKWVGPRPTYRGRMAIDPVTGTYQPRYPWYKTFLKVYLASVPIVILCMFIAFNVLLYYFQVEKMLEPYKKSYKGTLTGYIFEFAATVIYAILVAAMTIGYRKLADMLTEWENHRTQSQYDKHRVAKLVAFECVNNFMSFIYIAFVMQDLEMLKSQLVVMLIIMHMIVVLQEAILPLFIRTTSSKMKEFLDRDHTSRNRFSLLLTKKEPLAPSPSEVVRSHWLPSNFGLDALSSNDPRIEMRKFEGEMVPYKGSFDDYLQLFIQFGYVFLFSPVFPFAAPLAALTNIFLIWANVFKLCQVFQRPIPKRVKDIGTWQVAFELIGVLSVMTNSALIVLSTDIKSYSRNKEWTDTKFYFALFACEHVIMGLKIAGSYLIPDIPYWVKIALAKIEYKAKMALKKEQQTNSRRRLTLRFQAINMIIRDRDRENSESRQNSVGTSRRRLSQSDNH